MYLMMQSLFLYNRLEYIVWTIVAPTCNYCPYYINQHCLISSYQKYSLNNNNVNNDVQLFIVIPSETVNSK